MYLEMDSITSLHIMRALCDTIFPNKCSALPLYLIYLAILVITVMEININAGWGAEQVSWHHRGHCTSQIPPCHAATI